MDEKMTGHLSIKNMDVYMIKFSASLSNQIKEEEKNKRKMEWEIMAKIAYEFCKLNPIRCPIRCSIGYSYLISSTSPIRISYALVA